MVLSRTLAISEEHICLKLIHSPDVLTEHSGNEVKC